MMLLPFKVIVGAPMGGGGTTFKAVGTPLGDTGNTFVGVDPPLVDVHPPLVDVGVLATTLPTQYPLVSSRFTACLLLL